MAEAFGLAASVFATIQIADRVISLCKQYIQGVKEARADLRAILVETSTIKATLETVKSVIDLDAGQSDSLSGLEGPLGPVESCRKAIAELEELLASASRATPSGSKRRKIQATYENLAWPFKREKARGLLEELAMQKSTITLTLTADSLLVMKDIQESTGRIQQMLTDSDRRDVYTWLQHTDPSTIHHRACDNYEKGTCDWPSKLPEWDDFLQGKTRCLWIHGIPGAGKTILASQLIERLEEHCESFNTERTTSLYYYCYFGHNQDEAIPFLKWLLSRLCRRAESIPKLLWKLFKRGDTPSLTNFLITIEHALEHFDTVYVTIDALDESQSRGNLLKVVRDLMTDFRFSKIHLLATSREYLDIEKVMEPISMEVSMKNPFLDDDIRTYTVACINREGRMMSWTQQLRDETVEALVEGAKGMFRWVVCQVDMLKRVRGNGDAIREELRRLPKTLDETYTRIFDQIPKEDAMFVDVALGWMYFCHYLNDGRFLRRDLTLRIEVLANAVQWEVARASARGRNSACDSRLLREACGCLISVTGDDEVVSFAHYTILEFLESRSAPDSPESWRLDNLVPKFEESTLQAVVQVTEEDVREGFEEIFIRKSPFRTFAMFCISKSIALVARAGHQLSPQKMAPIVAGLVDPAKPHFPHLQKCWLLLHDKSNFDDVYSAMRVFCKADWSTGRSCHSEAPILINLLLVNPTGDLVKEWVKTVDIHTICESQVEMRYKFWHPPFRLEHDTFSSVNSMVQQSFKTLHLQERVLDVCVILFHAVEGLSVDAIKLLLQRGAEGSDKFDLNNTLLYHIGACQITEYPAVSKSRCLLQELLRLGAAPNSAGRRVTPLQIAVAVLDVQSTQTLLESGADVNDAGCPSVSEWSGENLLSIFNHLSGMSLSKIYRLKHIYHWAGYRNPEAISDKRLMETDEQRWQIQQLLSRYGAKEPSFLSLVLN